MYTQAMLDNLEQRASMGCTLARQSNDYPKLADIALSYIKNTIEQCPVKTEYFDDTPLILLMSGQSNATGTTAFVASDEVVAKKIEFSNIFGSYLQSLKTTTDSSLKNMSNASWIGFGIPCAEEILKYKPTKTIYVISISLGGAGLTYRNGAYNSSQKSWNKAYHLLRDSAVNKVNGILATLPRYKMIGTLWLQGESERDYVVQGDAALQDFRDSAEDVIRWHLNTFGGNFYISNVAYWVYNFTNTNFDLYDSRVDKVNEEWARAASKFNNAYIATTITSTFRERRLFNYADTGGAAQTNIHYSQEGYDVLGRSFAHFILPFIK